MFYSALKIQLVWLNLGTLRPPKTSKHRLVNIPCCVCCVLCVVCCGCGTCVFRFLTVY